MGVIPFNAIPEVALGAARKNATTQQLLAACPLLYRPAQSKLLKG
jgi:hypothetical protein